MLAFVTNLAVVAAEESGEVTNPILPDWAELAWGLGCWIVLYVFMRTVGYPSVVKTMNERAERIRDAAASVDSAQAEVAQTKAEHDDSLGDARAEASRIIEDARSEAEADRAELMRRVQGEVAEQRATAAQEIAAAKAQAVADLRGEVGELAVGAASSVVQRPLRLADEQAVIDEVVQQSGAER